MPNITYTKFKSGIGDGLPILYRQENNRGKEVVFAISGTDITILKLGEGDINFDAKSDEILAGILQTSLPSNVYFKWIEADFFPCKPEEILYKPLGS